MCTVQSEKVYSSYVLPLRNKLSAEDRSFLCKHFYD